MASDVSMCNNALLLIGHSGISALSENVHAEAFYLTTYQDVLTQHRWNFATLKAQLAQLVGEPLFEYKYKYQLPAGLLIIDRTYPSSNYKIYQDELHSNLNQVQIEYRYQVGEGYLPPYFVVLMEYCLAAKFAVPVTESETKADLYRKFYNDQLVRAKFLDAQSVPQDPVSHNPFLDVRGGDLTDG